MVGKDELAFLPAYRLVELLIKGGLEPEDYVEAVYSRAERLNKVLNAYITLRCFDEVLKEVKQVVEKARRGESLPLAGILLAVKDNICTKGLRTTCASRMLECYIPPYDATVIARLKKAGAVIIGKTNMDEFAMGSTNELSAFGPARNPWDTERVPGGSSGGSAVVVSAGMATVALGSDTGGSIRLPAAWTGIYGLKPTYGLVSRYGLVAYADSLEQIGPMARHPRDIALLMEVMAGFDDRDSTTLRVRSWHELPGLKGRPKIAVAKDILEHPGVDERVSKLVWEFVDKIQSLGYQVDGITVDPRIWDLLLPTYYIIAMSEASSNLARYTGVLYGPCKRELPEGVSWMRWYSEIRAYGFGWEVKRRIMMGAFALSAGYRDALYEKALRVRRFIRDRMLEALRNYDMLILPACVSPPPRIGEVATDPIRLYALDLATTVVNLSALPGLTIPIGFVDHLPVGAQLVGKPLYDRIIVEFAEILEEELKLYKKPPI